MRERLYRLGDCLGRRRWQRQAARLFPWLLVVVIIGGGVGDAAERCGPGSYPILEQVPLGGEKVWICRETTR